MPRERLKSIKKCWAKPQPVEMTDSEYTWDRQEAWIKKIVLWLLLRWFGLLLPDILIKIRDIELINFSNVSRIRKMILEDDKGKYCPTGEESRVLENSKLSLRASTCYMQNCNNFCSEVICPGSFQNRYIKFSSGQDKKKKRPVSMVRKALFTAGTVKSFRWPRHWASKKVSNLRFPEISLQNIPIDNAQMWKPWIRVL